MKTKAKKWFQFGTLAAVLSLSPFVFTAEGEVEVQEAFCQESGMCCPQAMSLCSVGDHHYMNHFWKELGGICAP